MPKETDLEHREKALVFLPPRYLHAGGSENEAQPSPAAWEVGLRAAEAKTLFLEKAGQAWHVGTTRTQLPCARAQGGRLWGEATALCQVRMQLWTKRLRLASQASRSTELFSACGRRIRNPLVACKKRERAWGGHPCSVSKTWPKS